MIKNKSSVVLYKAGMLEEILYGKVFVTKYMFVLTMKQFFKKFLGCAPATILVNGITIYLYHVVTKLGETKQQNMALLSYVLVPLGTKKTKMVGSHFSNPGKKE